MNVVLGIALFVLFVWALIKGWIWIVNSIMDSLIEKAEKRDAEVLKNNPEYQFWAKTAERVKELAESIKRATAPFSSENENPKPD